MSEVASSQSPSPSNCNPPFSQANGSKKKNGAPSTSKPSPYPVVTSPNQLLDDDGQRKGRKESEQRRRVLMNQYYDELVILLSMISERKIPKKMDKASTLHEAVRCLRTYAELTIMEKKQPTKMKGRGGGKGGSKMPKEILVKGMRPDLISNGDTLQWFLDAHDTFLILISESGHILYATELITSLLGHMQTRLVGQNIYDYVPEVEKSTLRDMFNPGNAKPSPLQPPSGKILAYPAHSFKCHFKMYSGETCNLTQHLPFCCISYLRQWKEKEEPLSPISPPLSPFDFSSGETESTPLPRTDSNRHQSCVLLFGKLPTDLTLLDLPIGVNDVNFTFDMRVSKEGIIISIDSHAVLVLGYTESELIGSRFFDYIDPYHLCDVGDHMASVFNSTCGTTNPYRLFTKGGRYVWLLSKGYLSYNPWNHKPDHILLNNRILGCDHVVPEFRFFRSRMLLPDLEGDKLYDPAVPKDVSGTLPQKQQPHQSGGQQKTLESSSSLDHLSTLSDPKGSSLPTEICGNAGGMKSEALPGSVHCGGQENGATDSNIHQMVGHGVQTGTQDVQHLGVQNIAQSREGDMMTGMQQEQQSRFMMDYQQEMEKKNNELFNMQRRLLEQQMLMEQERSQFYQVAQHVLQYIGTPLHSTSLPLPPSLQLSYFTSQPGQSTTVKKMPSSSDCGSQPTSSCTSSVPSSSTKPPSVSTPSGLSSMSSAPGTSSFTQATYSGLPQAIESTPPPPPLSPLQLLQQMSNRSSSSTDNLPYSLLLAQSSNSALGHNAASSLPPNPHMQSSSAAASMSNHNLSAPLWQGLPAVLPNQPLQQLHQLPGILGQQFNQQQYQMSQLLHQGKQDYGQHQQRMQQQPQNSIAQQQRGLFTHPTTTPLPGTVGGMQAALPQLGSINLLSNNPILNPSTSSTFSSNPYQNLVSQFKVHSTESHNPPLQAQAAISTSDTIHVQAPTATQPQSDTSTGVSMRLPNDEEIQNLLDAIQMKCSNTSVPGVSSPSFS